MSESLFAPESTLSQSSAYSIASEKHPKRNEDNYFLMSGQTFGVFDGVGGLNNGDVASRKAKDFIQTRLVGIPHNNTPEYLLETVTQASKQIFQENQKLPNKKKMSTTACVASIYEQNGQKKVVVVNVGDSRAWLVRGGEVIQVTIDDSYVENSDDMDPNQLRRIKAASQRNLSNYTGSQGTSDDLQQQFSHRNRIDSSLGLEKNIKPTVYEWDISNGDQVILTTDGVHDNLTQDQIKQIINLNPNHPNLSSLLVEEAQKVSKLPYEQNIRSKKDDMTAIAVTVSEHDDYHVQSPNRVSLSPSLPPQNTPQKFVGNTIASLRQRIGSYFNQQTPESLPQQANTTGQLIEIIKQERYMTGPDNVRYTGAEVARLIESVQNGSSKPNELPAQIRSIVIKLIREGK